MTRVDEIDDPVLRNYVAALERENEELRERVLQLEVLAGMRNEVPVAFCLTGQESRLFGVLLQRDLVTKRAAMDALYGERADDPPEEKIIDVFVCKMRAKLAKFDERLVIDTVWGKGYRVPPHVKEIVRAVLARENGEAPPVSLAAAG